MAALRKSRTASRFAEDRPIRGQRASLASTDEHDESDPASDPLERWQSELASTDEHPLHAGDEVRAAVAARTEVTYEAYVPHLWRHILGTGTSTDEPWTGPAATYLRDVERRRIAEGTLPAIGLRLAAAQPR